MGKLVLVLCDGLRDDTARTQMGYLEHTVAVRRASRMTALAELPTLSRPCYEAIHAGVGCAEHGVTTNHLPRRSVVPNVFGLAVAAGRTTAAAAYYWFSELYNGAPFDDDADREVDDPKRAIQHGRFYRDESTPDGETCAAASMLTRRWDPDYLLVHPMGLDYRGHRDGAGSREYRTHATHLDELLAALVPQWLASGRTVVLTADHGHDDDRSHGGTSPAVRRVPLYVLPRRGRAAGDTGRVVSQLRLAPTICAALGIRSAPTMGGRPLAVTDGPSPRRPGRPRGRGRSPRRPAPPARGPYAVARRS
ncbi:MAG: alkaline phosphatase family protein [Actinobacteria bacterium]|nr:alkaline phosphatase family protein [Actinomycetota bacterium]